MAGPSMSGEKLRKERVYERRGGTEGREVGGMCCMVAKEDLLGRVTVFNRM